MSRAKAVIILRNPSTGERAGRLSAGGKTQKAAVAAVKRLAAKLGIPVSGGKGRNPGLFETIRPGDRVTISTPQGQTRTGRAVMLGPGGWVLNLGGRYGTPGIANERNIVSVRKAGGGGKHSLAIRRLIMGNPRTRISDKERRLWVLNDSYLYGLWQRSPEYNEQLDVSAWIKKHRPQIDNVIAHGGTTATNPGRRGNVTA